VEVEVHVDVDVDDVDVDVDDVDVDVDVDDVDADVDVNVGLCFKLSTVAFSRKNCEGTKGGTVSLIVIFSTVFVVGGMFEVKSRDGLVDEDTETISHNTTPCIKL
jgi:hypothetical protein